TRRRCSASPRTSRSPSTGRTALATTPPASGCSTGSSGPTWNCATSARGTRWRWSRPGYGWRGWTWGRSGHRCPNPTRRTSPGLDVFDVNGLTRRVGLALGQVTPDSPTELVGAPSVAKTVASTLSAFEVALFDAQGRALGRRVCDLLGGAVRAAVPFSGYLFYKWAGHPGEGADEFGPALDPDEIGRAHV